MSSFPTNRHSVRAGGHGLPLNDFPDHSEARVASSSSHQDCHAAQIWPHLQLLHATERAASEQGAHLYQTSILSTHREDTVRVLGHRTVDRVWVGG